VRDLHVVALSDDGRHIVLATRPDVEEGEFRVPVDVRLASAVRGELPRRGASVPPPVTPREIQARLRAGESVEQIASSAGLPASRIERFAGPVLSEIERMVDGARAAVVVRARRGRSALPLGEAVDQHLGEASGYRPEETVWSARREQAGRWVVEVSWVVRGRRREAGWSYDPSSREVTPVDAGSAALGHVDAAEAPTARPATGAARRPPVVGPRPVTPPDAAGGATPRTGTRDTATTASPGAGKPAAASATRGTRTGARTTAAGPAAAARPTAAAKPATTARPPAAAAALPATPGTTRRVPARPAAAAPAATGGRRAATPAATKPAPTKTARSKPARSKPARATPPAATSPAPTSRPLLRVVRPVEVDDGDEATGRAAARDAGSRVARTAGADQASAATAPAGGSRRAAGQRASVPDWADVLLGTAPVRPSPGEQVPRRGGAPEPS